MAPAADLPCDGDGLCMACKSKPPPEDTLSCKICATPWHVPCLSESLRPQTMSDVAQWDCPDCVNDGSAPDRNSVLASAAAASGSHSELLAKIQAIERDGSLSAQEKARQRQKLLGGGAQGSEVNQEGRRNSSNEARDINDQKLYCSICMHILDRPVTTPCGHNFCLKCFQKWVAQGGKTCANCRNHIPAKMISEPKINYLVVWGIRAAKALNSNAPAGPSKPVHFIHNQNRPDKAFLSDRAKKSGKANASSGKIFVTIPNDHFGPILPENDPEKNRGVIVGDMWEGRMECRQWGAHFPHVAGIAGQSYYGAQSVALSGGYEDDEDHGEWFLYTGSGGRDLSGNKRVNKKQSFDQEFNKLNQALRISCLKGYPVRVVRSSKVKGSSYAPAEGLRYDGVYRIEKCWRKVGQQGFKMCRYLFIRCDNDPAPWTSETQGDRPRHLPVINELEEASDITARKESPAWDYDEGKGCWIWKKGPPKSRFHVGYECDDEGTKSRKVGRQKKLSIKEKLLKEFSCLICRKVMVLPLSTPCGHNFCKACLQGAFAGQSSVRERTCEGRRTLRTQKNIMKCPFCKNDISDFLLNPQVNRELMDVIESLQRKIEEENADSAEEADDSEEGLKAESSEEANGTDSKPELNEEASEGAEAELDTHAGDRDNFDLNSGVLVEVKDKTEDIVQSLDSSKFPEKLKKCITSAAISPNKSVHISDSCRSSRAKSKLSNGEELKATSVADEGKRVFKRKAEGEGTLPASLDVKTRSKKAKEM